MIRVLHERCKLESSSKNSVGDVIWTTRATNVPCEMVPQSSVEKNDRGIAVTTDYLWVTRSTVIPSTQTNWRVVWRGRNFTVQGHVEDHYSRGRLQHREAVVRLA